MSEQSPTLSSVSALPGGMLALLFTDIEGSTRLIQSLGEAYPAQLEAHRRILRAAFAAHAGVEVDTQGDAFFAVFRSVKNALAASIQAQRELQSFPWPSDPPLRVRMGLHCGELTPFGSGYVGVDLHRGARLMMAAHGGQVLLSNAAAALVSDLPQGCALRDLGEHHLRDLPHPERIFQLCLDGLPDEFPPPRTLNKQLHNLPARLLPILGREQEIEAGRAQLQMGTSLTTLLGPGGTGKTRLALEIAATTLALWRDGVYFVPLAPLPPPDDTLSPSVLADAIAGAVARELGLCNDGAQDAQAQLLAHLKTRQMLLVLDNFEHLVGGATVVAQWLAACPRLQILATSRVPLRLSGEQEMPIAPLPLPRCKPLPPIETLPQFAGVALFIERARAVQPQFTLNTENAAAIAEICARLDGLPLAIELAAARIKLLPPAVMLARMVRSLSFLAGGVRDASARQRTLRATIAWSYNLLSDAEKCLFRRLGVFRGGFGFDSAEQVCAVPLEADATPLDVFEGIAALLDQNLLVGCDTTDGQARFAMLELIREFALEELEAAGEGEALRERHLAWCLQETTERATEMRHDLRHALHRFELEADNWRAAWNWSFGVRPAAALRLAAEAALLWNRSGGTSENYERLEASLRAAPTAPAQYRCGALHFLIQADRHRASWPQYERRLEQLETLAREANLPEFQAIALDQRRWDEVAAGHLETALEHGARIVELCRLCLEQTQHQPLNTRAIEQSQLELSDAMILQVEILVKVGRFDEAHRLMEESLAMKRASGDEGDLTFGLYKYAQLLADTGHIAEARPILEQVVQRAEASGDRSLMLAWYRHDAALLAMREGDTARGQQLLRASYAVFKENAGNQGFLMTLHMLAYLHGLEGNWPLVALTLGAADTARGTPYPDDWHDILEAQKNAARVALGYEEFEAQRAAGAQLDLQEAVEAALGNDALTK